MADELKLTQTELSNHAGPMNGWDNGWYVFEDGQVLGPLDAKEALGSEKSVSTGTIRMVSRKGFTQWYPVRDFAEIHGMIQTYSKALVEPQKLQKVPLNEVSPKKKTIASGVADASNMSTSSEIPDAHEHDENSLGQIPIDVLKSEVTSDASQSRVSRTSSPTIPREARVDLKQQPTTQACDAREDKETRKLMRAQVRRAKAAARNQNLMERGIFAERYFEIQNPLRLGRIFSPTMGALVYTPITLGGYWWDWFSRACQEVSWHLTGSIRTNFGLPIWSCMIPGVHLLLAYDLAKAVQSMEMQNGYRSTKPWLATLAAIFPPFYILMIQSALNKHWRLHVFNSAGIK